MSVSEESRSKSSVKSGKTEFICNTGEGKVIRVASEEKKKKKKPMKKKKKKKKTSDMTPEELLKHHQVVMKWTKKSGLKDIADAFVHSGTIRDDVPFLLDSLKGYLVEATRKKCSAMVPLVSYHAHGIRMEENVDKLFAALESEDEEQLLTILELNHGILMTERSGDDDSFMMQLCEVFEGCDKVIEAAKCAYDHKYMHHQQTLLDEAAKKNHRHAMEIAMEIGCDPATTLDVFKVSPDIQEQLLACITSLPPTHSSIIKVCKMLTSPDQLLDDTDKVIWRIVNNRLYDVGSVSDYLDWKMGQLEDEPVDKPSERIQRFIDEWVLQESH